MEVNGRWEKGNVEKTVFLREKNRPMTYNSKGVRLRPPTPSSFFHEIYMGLYVFEGLVFAIVYRFVRLGLVSIFWDQICKMSICNWVICYVVD